MSDITCHLVAFLAQFVLAVCDVDHHTDYVLVGRT